VEDLLLIDANDYKSRKKPNNGTAKSRNPAAFQHRPLHVQDHFPCGFDSIDFVSWI